MRNLSFLYLPLAFSLVACDGGTDDKEEDTDAADTETMEETDEMELGTIVEIAAGTPRFSILVAAVTKAGLAGALDGVTVFAPNDDAFEALFDAIGVESVDDLSVEQLTPILTYHVLTGSVDAAAATAVANGAGSTASLGGSLDLAIDGTALKVDAATVIGPDIMASNGIIHEIDAVLLPNLVDVATTDPELSVLTSALLAVDASELEPDLVGTLGGAGPFTVFAPVNSAFTTMLEANDAADLGAFVTAVGVGTVIDVLTYHVASGSVLAETVVTLDSATTLGGTVTITVDGGVVLNQGVDGVGGTNDANVIVTDILTSNGVIHKIDKVITPASEPVVAEPVPVEER